MADGKFKPGDIVYHKATKQRGVIAEAGAEGFWRITWVDGKKDYYTEAELWTEEEFNQQESTIPEPE